MKQCQAIRPDDQVLRFRYRKHIWETHMGNIWETRKYKIDFKNLKVKEKRAEERQFREDEINFVKYFVWKGKKKCSGGISEQKDLKIKQVF